MTGYRDLREFLRALESRGDLRRITYPLDPRLEITEVCRRVIKAAGPALLFESPKGASMPLLANLFGTPERVAFAVGKSSVQGLREIGERLALLREPQPPQSLRALWEDLPVYKQILNVPPKVVAKPRFLEVVTTSADVDLDILPMQTCWPEDSAPLITWGLVVTRGPAAKRQNVGIYRQQRLSRNELIMRWLPQRGGALDFAAWKAAHPGKPFPVAVVIGADPASMLAAVAPIPDNIGELQFAGLLRGTRTEVADLGPMKLQVPASAEIVLEGHIDPERTELEGPFGDHTGYYNEAQRFPVFVVDKFYRRQAAIYLSTYTGRPPDEPAMLGVAMNELFVPLLRKQFPEIVDFYLPPEACSYRVAVVSIRKEYPGHARRLMMAIWSYLRQFLYTKYIIVVDEDIDIRAWDDVIWALSTRADPDRDLTLLRGTPVDYLDFASPQAGLGGKLGIDATNKLPGETERQWGRPIEMTSEVVARVDGLWRELGL